MVTKGHLSKESLKSVSALREVVENLRNFHPKMELGTLLIYLMVLEEGEVNLKVIETRAKLSKSALSRNAKLLGTSSYKVDDVGEPEPGLGLIRTLSDPFDSRAYLVMPTATGRHLAEGLSGILKKHLGAFDGT